MEIAFDYSLRRDPRDAELWKEYCAGLFRARMLTWSTGLRDRLGLAEEVTDEAITDSADAEGFIARFIDGREWDRQRDVPGARARLLEDVERHPPRQPVHVEPKRPKLRPVATLVRRPPLPLAKPRTPKPTFTSREERELRLEELRHHLYVDLGLASA